MLPSISALLYAAIVVGLVLLLVLHRRMQTIRRQRDLGARLERIAQRHGHQNP